MTTIPRDLLTAKGTIDALLTLTYDVEAATVQQMATAMDVAGGTARDRLDTLGERDLVTESARLRNGAAVRVYEITEDGEELSQNVKAVLADDEV